MDVDEQTLLQYERLSYFEKEEVTAWIKKHFSEIPMPSKIKKTGLEQLLAGDFSARSTLAIIRCAMSALRIHSK